MLLTIRVVVFSVHAAHVTDVHAAVLRTLPRNPSSSLTKAVSSSSMPFTPHWMDNPLRRDDRKMAQAQLPAMSCFQLSHGKFKLMARPSGGHAALSGGEAFCTFHISPILFDAEMEELVCCEYPTKGKRCPSPLHVSLISILNSLGSPPYHGTSYYRYKLINNT